MILDEWQKKVLKTKGNICLRSGRQVGKSTIIAVKAGDYALDNANKLVMIIAKTERQALLLFTKTLRNIHNKNPGMIKKGKDRPTKHEVQLRNGSTILCLPAGDTGFGIMGYTIDLLIADEAAFIPEEVWNSITPALAVTGGDVWLLSTPFIKEGYYYRCFHDDKFTSFHQSSEDNPRQDQAHLDHQKSWMTPAQYAQMYLGEFRDEFQRMFPEELIMKACIGKRRPINKRGIHYLGCDVARKDRDEFTYEIAEKINRKRFEHVENIKTHGIPIPDSARRIIALDLLYNFKKEFIDSGGMGITVCDILRESRRHERKVIEINNASRPTEYFRSHRLTDNKGKEKTILKDELYENLISMMMQKQAILLDDADVKASLRSMQWEYKNKDSMKKVISGTESHICEGLVRAFWGFKDKSLNIRAFC